MRTALGLGLVVVLLTGCQGDEAGDVTTTQEAVDGGRDIDYWGEPDL